MYALKIIKGPLEGRVFDIQNNMKIGRSRGDVVLEDSLVSDFHAEIKLNSKGDFMLLDLDSKNGILFEDKKRNEVNLKKGVEFKIGRNVFQVFLNPNSQNSASQNPLGSFLEKNLNSFTDKSPETLSAFSHHVELHFLSGPQEGENCHLTYGPCIFEKDENGNLVLSQNVSNCLFCITSNHKSKNTDNQIDKHAIFVLSEQSQIKLNDKNIKEQIIKSNDVITFDDTQIELKVL